jgi:hypothetical protein
MIETNDHPKSIDRQSCLSSLEGHRGTDEQYHPKSSDWRGLSIIESRELTERLIIQSRPTDDAYHWRRGWQTNIIQVLPNGRVPSLE